MAEPSSEASKRPVKSAIFIDWRLSISEPQRGGANLRHSYGATPAQVGTWNLKPGTLVSPLMDSGIAQHQSEFLTRPPTWKPNQTRFGKTLRNSVLIFFVILLAPSSKVLAQKNFPSTRAQQSAAKGSVATRHCQITVVIDTKERFQNVPFGVELDFDHLLEEHKVHGTFDRFSVRVRKRNPKTRQLEEVDFNLSDAFLIGNKGRVNWLIEDTNEREYVIFFDVKENGPFAPPQYIGLVGNGDCLRYNDGKLHPLHVGMHASAVAVDWDGDGKTDVLSPQIYSHTAESPWFCLRFFRNEGSNDKPFFGEGVPLRVWKDDQPRFIETGYALEILDWNNDGRLDVLTFPYTKKELSIYLNTGRKDGSGLPVVELVHTVPMNSPGLFTCLRVVDWCGDGRKSLLLGYITTHYPKRDDPLWFPASEQEKDAAKWPRMFYKSGIDLYENSAAPGEAPHLKPPVQITTRDKKEISFHTVSSFEWTDWDGDGRHDLLVQNISELFDQGFVGVEYYENVGNANSPQFERRGNAEPFRDKNALNLREVNAPGFRGMFAHPGTAAGKIQFFSREKRARNGVPLFKDMGFLQQRNAFVNSYSGYAQGQLSDWDKDGDLDLITGCETGFVLHSENIGSQKKPVFREPEFVKQHGEVITLLNGPFTDPSSLMEASIGQTAPMYEDWDADGILDLVVVIGPKLLFYKNTGSPARPKLLAPVEILADNGQKLMKHRNKPALIDWNRDGLLDVVGHDPDEKNLFLFKRYRDAKTGDLKLANGTALFYTNGAPVVPAAWHRYVKYFNAGDWKGRGVFDLWLSASDQILYLENVGTNEKPLFLPPVRLMKDGKPIRIGHHVSTPFPVDWDGDGKMDLLVSGESGLFHLFRRNYLDGTDRKITYRFEN